MPSAAIFALRAHSGAADGHVVFPGLPRPIHRIAVLAECACELADGRM
jgi:hypothetical protein